MLFYCYLLLSPGGFGHLQIFMRLPYMVINLFLFMHVSKTICASRVMHCK